MMKSTLFGIFFLSCVPCYPESRADLALEAKLIAKVHSAEELLKTQKLLYQYRLSKDQCEFEKQSHAVPAGCFNHLEMASTLGMISSHDLVIKKKNLLSECKRMAERQTDVDEVKRALRDITKKNVQCAVALSQRLETLKYKAGDEVL
jgi:hypothetical protein